MLELGQQIERTVMQLEIKKFCPVCETWFNRPKGKSNKVWEAQVCCGRDCSFINKRKKDLPRNVKRRKELVPGKRRYSGIGGTH